MARSVYKLDVGGHVRGLVLHPATPPAAPSLGHSLLLLLHGSTEDRNNGSVHYPAERFERNYHAVFAGHGFVLVYLSARLSNGWYCWENGNAEVGLCARSSCLLTVPAAAVPQLASLASWAPRHALGPRTHGRLPRDPEGLGRPKLPSSRPSGRLTRTISTSHAPPSSWSTARWARWTARVCTCWA